MRRFNRYDRVVISEINPYTGTHDRSPFAGKTGTVLGFEMDGRTKLYRVRLDLPVDVCEAAIIACEMEGAQLRDVVYVAEHTAMKTLSIARRARRLRRRRQ